MTITAGWSDLSHFDVKPGTPAWMRYMTASKVAAVMGHSTYDSWFSLWHRMKGNILPDPESEEARRGHYLEPSVIEWFKDQHPDWTYTRTGMWVHPEIDWAASSPDGIAHTPDGPVLVEAKSSNDPEWGEPGTDQIPAGFRDQGTWQMLTTGLRRVYFPMIGAGLRFAEYVLDYDADHAALLLERTTEFMRTQRANEKPSVDPLDGHLQTYKAIKELNPGIEDFTHNLDDDMAIAFLTANAEVKAAEERVQAARNVIADAAGEAHYIDWNDQRMFTRQSRNGGTPYLVASKALPTL